MLLGLACTAHAGAWPREQGTGFVSVAMRPSWSRDSLEFELQSPAGTYNTLYIEYGLAERVTIGLDLGRSVSGGNKTVGFVQVPLALGETGRAISLQLGFGEISDEMVVRPGVALGVGRAWGWLSLEGIVEYQISTHQSDVKVDATFGKNMLRDSRLILQVQMGKQVDDPFFARFAPSIVNPLGKHLKVETGGAIGLTGDNSIGLKLGLWSDF